MIIPYRSSDQHIQSVYLVVTFCPIVIGASMIGLLLVISITVVVMLDVCLMGESEIFGYLDDSRIIMDIFVGST